MGMNPDTNKLEPLKELAGELLRPDGTKVPKHWCTLRIGELVTIKDYTFRVAYIGESNVLFEPVAPDAMSKTEELKSLLAAESPDFYSGKK